ncbi:MAG: M15 family metallopeptidase [Clostridiales bacterium]|nr:M15 family metallopeptidase [Clostridiales bacterium]
MLTKLMATAALIAALGQFTVDAYVEKTSLGGMLYLVNTEYTLSADYVPPDLVRPRVRTDYGNLLMRSEAAKALEELFQAAKDEEGFILEAVSGYRSYGKQRAIYQRKIQSTGDKAKASLLVAPPGASEHQLGLAMDIGRKGGSGLTARFGDTREGQWVAQNAHRFGYIIRYKEEWTAITGYAYEPWHIRYVGKEHAGRLFELDIPLDTYVAMLSEAAFGAYLGSAGE